MKNLLKQPDSASPSSDLSAKRGIWRFAPSPNGYLHLGHAYSAILNFEAAKRAGGRFLLRIEDIDAARAKPAFEQAIYEDLDWLGLSWEKPARRQSEHAPTYAQAIARLDEMGLLYPCFCARGETNAAVADKADWPRDPDGVPLYPQICRHADAASLEARRGEGRRPALRIKMDEAAARCGDSISWRESALSEPVRAAPEAWGDAIIARRDIGLSYHVAVVVDDALQGVSEVVRGGDLFASTSVHRVLQILLGLPEPAYRHHSLIRGENGEKLSKSRQSQSLRDLRAQGCAPRHIRAMLGL